MCIYLFTSYVLSLSIVRDTQHDLVLSEDALP